MPTGARTRRRRPARGIRTAAVAVVALLAVTGCAASKEDFEQAVIVAVLAVDPNIVDVHLALSSGFDGRGFRLRLYLGDTGVEAAADSVDDAFEAAFHASLSNPTSITVDIAEEPKPEEVDLAEGSLPIDEVADEAGLPSTGDEIRLARDELEERYGAWEPPPQ